MTPKRPNPPGYDTSEKVAKAASKLLRHPETATKQEIKTVAAAALGGTVPRPKPKKR